jgi:hypothetical protein
MLLYLLIGAGLTASLFGFAVAFWAVLRFRAGPAAFLFTAGGLCSTLYGFACAGRSVARGQPARVGPRALALVMTSMGLLATGFAFYRAFRGLSFLAVTWRILLSTLAAAGLAGAGCGFVCAYRAILRHGSARPVRG